MSVPQPIHVALVGSTAELVCRAKKYFRLSAPGIGAAYVATLESKASNGIQHLEQLPYGLITLWVALDAKSLAASKRRHHMDLVNPRYSRGFYEEHLPEPCVLIHFEDSPSESKKQLAQLAQRIIEAWYATS